MGTKDAGSCYCGALRVLRVRVVEVSGIEPLTSCMPCKRSPS